MTPLHVAAKKGESLDIVEYLIDKGADINIKDYNGVSESIHTTDCIHRLFILMFEKFYLA